MSESELREKLFYAMRSDIETMSEYGDNEHALLAEIMTVDADILSEYASVFLTD